ncbi:hypothetical protein BD769DRAFT_1683394 [Suillus cothurnatus]|nr:hypothetical protein BD769DRAFT_1683394 [Suillus cothurnatus]
MSNSTLFTYDLVDFTARDAANVLDHMPQMLAYKASFVKHLQWEADHFVFPYTNICLVLNVHPTMPNLLRSVIGRLVQFKTGTVTPEQLHDEFITYCSPNDPKLSLGLELLILNVREVMEMTQDNWSPMGAMLVPGPTVTGQVDGDALFNQMVAVRAHLQHLGEAMSSLLDQKTQVAAEAMSTMSQLDAPIAEVAEALLNPVDELLASFQFDLDMIQYNEALDRCSTGRTTKHEEDLLQKFLHGSQQLLEKPLVLVDSGGHIILWYLPGQWFQTEMEEATVSMGDLLKMSMTGGQEAKW